MSEENIMYNLDLNAIVSLLIKYKSQVTYSLAGVGLIAIFFIGRMSISIPPKEVICKAEIETKNKLFDQLKECRDESIEKLRLQRDSDERVCLNRISKAVKDTQKESEIVDCETVKALYPQCKRKRRR
jgi:hypothetical protein